MSGVGFTDRPFSPEEAERHRRVLEATEPPRLHGVSTDPLPPEEQAELNARIAEQLASPLDRYLVDVYGFLTKYIAFPSEHEPAAVTLWVAHTHLIEDLDVSPILAITSAEMRSGKTLILDCIEFLVAHAERMVTPSPAATYTAISQRPRPTLLLDEADAIFTRKRKGDADTEGLRAVFNAGNRRGVTVARVEMVGKTRKLERLDVFGAKAIAGIGRLPDTITDRSIVIRMRRKARSEVVARFRYRKVQAEAEAIGAPDWTSVTLVTDVTDLDGRMSDRAQDSWEPLIAIADEAGGGWPVAARQAAAVLSSEEDGQVSDGIRLLQDIRDVMVGSSHVTSSVLLQLLYEVDESRWDDYYGSQLSARRLAQLLDPYDIGPRLARVGEEHQPQRGYFRSDFEDAWRRYLPSVPDGTVTSVTSVTGDTDSPSGTADQTAEAETIFADLGGEWIS